MFCSFSVVYQHMQKTEDQDQSSSRYGVEINTEKKIMTKNNKEFSTKSRYVVRFELIKLSKKRAPVYKKFQEKHNKWQISQS